VSDQVLQRERAMTASVQLMRAPRLGDALRAEWTKLRTVPATAWTLAAIVVATLGVSAAAVSATSCPAGLSCPVDTGRLSLTGVQVGQAVVAILAAAAITSEYSTGMIKTTLAAMPGRLAMLTAKAALITGLVLAAAAVAVLGSVLVGGLVLPGHGFTSARGFLDLSLSDGTMLRAAGGSVLYLALIGLLSIGVAVLLRDSAAAIGTVLGLLYLFPIVASFVQNEAWHNRLERWAPTNAGLAIQATTGLRGLPISPWSGLGVLAIWAGAALLAGGLMLRLRDA
jgi:ABC-2 type transport system permease protein